MPTRTATEDVISVDDFASGLSDRYLHCRELGHVWKSWTVNWDPKAKCYERQLRCTGCRTIRKQVLDGTGHVIRNGYDYAKGYLAEHVETGVSRSRDVFRLEAIVRAIEKPQAVQAAS